MNRIQHTTLESPLLSTVHYLFTESKISALLAWKYDPFIDDVRPALFKRKDPVSEVCFDRRCVHNLTNYLPEILERFDKIGVLLKGCDGRSLAVQIAEHKIQKDRIIALAPACDGVVINGEKAPKCLDCPVTISPIADYIFGERHINEEPKFPDLHSIESMPPEKRWAFFSHYFQKCTRCYACRQICPLCFCESCVADQHGPKWIESSAKLSSNTMWHLTRAYHLAGRCADCRECERVCPEGIPLHLLNNAMEKTVYELFSLRPGIHPGEQSPFIVLSDHDPDEILGKQL